MIADTGAGRWIVGLLLCCLFAASSWYAVRALSEARDARENLAVLNTVLHKARAGQQRLELRIAHASRAGQLLEKPGLWDSIRRTGCFRF